MARARAGQLGTRPGIGAEIACSVARFFAGQENRAVLQHLREAGVQVQSMQRSTRTGPLAGKTIVLTGSLENYTRKQASERVEALGGRVTSSVSGRTDYVVAGENPGSKLDNARQHEVNVLDENAFEKLVEDVASD